MLEQFDTKRLYDIYKVKVQFRDRIYGGMPKSAELIRKWVEARTKVDAPKTNTIPDEKTEEQIVEAIEVMTEEAAEQMWTGFPSDEEGLFVWDRQIKALFKECMQLAHMAKNRRGSKQVMQHGFEIKRPNPDRSNLDSRIHLGVKEPTGMEEGAIHVMTAQGPRTALKRADYVEQPTIEFEVWVYATAPQETRHIGEKQLVDLLTHAQENGLGAQRSQGHGKFNVTGFEVLHKAPLPKKEKKTDKKTPKAA